MSECSETDIFPVKDSWLNNKCANHHVRMNKFLLSCIDH